MEIDPLKLVAFLRGATKGVFGNLGEEGSWGTDPGFLVRSQRFVTITSLYPNKTEAYNKNHPLIESSKPQ